jgi:hypothetical protein
MSNQQDCRSHKQKIFRGPEEILPHLAITFNSNEMNLINYNDWDI